VTPYSHLNVSKADVLTVNTKRCQNSTTAAAAATTTIDFCLTCQKPLQV